MTKIQAEKELFNMLDKDAMVPVGSVNNLINRIYKDLYKEKTNLKKILNLNSKCNKKK